MICFIRIFVLQLFTMDLKFILKTAAQGVVVFTAVLAAVVTPAILVFLLSKILFDGVTKESFSTLFFIFISAGMIIGIILAVSHIYQKSEDFSKLNRL